MFWGQVCRIQAGSSPHLHLREVDSFPGQPVFCISQSEICWSRLNIGKGVFSVHGEMVPASEDVFQEELEGILAPSGRNKGKVSLEEQLCGEANPFCLCDSFTDAHHSHSWEVPRSQHLPSPGLEVRIFWEARAKGFVPKDFCFLICEVSRVLLLS